MAAGRTSRSAGRLPVLLVTGASGFVGRHLVRLPGAEGWDVVAPSSTTLDITDRRSAVAWVTALAPDAVIHLAYRKGERATIVDGAQYVAEAAVAVGARLVHVSTDIVFPGGPAPYVEADPPNPLIEYGQHKRDAERLVADVAPDAVIVRTSLVYGTETPSPAQVELADVLRSGVERTPSAYFTDEFRCPVHADDLAAALLQLAERSDVAGPLHVAGPELVDRFDLAVRFARHAGLGARTHAIRSSTIAESGLTRPARVELDVSAASALGIGCRPVSAVLAVR